MTKNRVLIIWILVAVYVPGFSVYAENLIILKGRIGKKRVTFHLYQKDNQVAGVYFSLPRQQDIPVLGTIEGKKFELTEYAVFHKTKGFFSGHIDKKTVRGKYLNLQKKARGRFWLTFTKPVLDNKIPPQKVRFVKLNYALRNLVKYMAFLVFKEERRVEMWVVTRYNRILLKTFPILGLSGTSGPKIREWDFQSPEGIYPVRERVNEMIYHKGLLMDYPNQNDLVRQKILGVTSPGYGLYMHGKSLSYGCVSMGDSTMDEIFRVIDELNVKKMKIISAPFDLRKKNRRFNRLLRRARKIPGGIELYKKLRAELFKYQNFPSISKLAKNE